MNDMIDRGTWRGVDVISKEIVYGSLVWPYGDPPQIGYMTKYNTKMYIVDFDTLGQCTMRKDVNGNYIFDKDLVSINGEKPYEVAYYAEVAGFVLKRGTDIIGFTDLQSKALEIVGTTFQGQGEEFHVLYNV